MNANRLTIVIPDSAKLIDAARMAAAQGLMLITNNKNTLASGDLLPGYYKMRVGFKA